MGSYRVEHSRLAYDGKLSRVRVDRLRMPDGQVAEREVVEHLDAVAVVPVDERGRVVLVRQYRVAVDDHLLELPAGILDVDGEDAAAAARRELIEEVGLDAGQLDELVTFANSAGWTDEHTRVYLGTGLRRVAPPDGYAAEHEEADLEVVRMPLSEAVDGIASGRVRDAKTVIGLLLARDRLGAGPGPGG